MELRTEKRQWIDKNTNEVKEYFVYFVEVAGVRIYLQPTDNTAKQLLQLYLNSKGGDVK